MTLGHKARRKNTSVTRIADVRIGKGFPNLASVTTIERTVITPKIPRKIPRIIFTSPFINI